MAQREWERTWGPQMFAFGSGGQDCSTEQKVKKLAGLQTLITMLHYCTRSMLSRLEKCQCSVGSVFAGGPGKRRPFGFKANDVIRHLRLFLKARSQMALTLKYRNSFIDAEDEIPTKPATLERRARSLPPRMSKMVQVEEFLQEEEPISAHGTIRVRKSQFFWKIDMANPQSQSLPASSCRCVEPTSSIQFSL